MIPKLNLLPHAYLPPPSVNWLKMGVIAVSLTLLFAMGTSIGKIYLDVKERQEEIRSLNAALSNLTPTQAKIQDMLKVEEEIARLQSLNKAAEQQELAWSALLADMARVMPPRLKFTEINAEGGEVHLLGTARSSLEVAQYVIELRKFQWFSQVEIISIELMQGSEYRFEITASLSQEGGQESVEEPVQQKPSA